MAYDLLPSKFFAFPTQLWDDENWLTTTSAHNGLSVSEDEKHIYVEAALPGMDSKNIDITYHEGQLWIKGETKNEEKDKTRKYYRKATQSFSYRVAIPGDVDENTEPTADYNNGVMTVTFLKVPKTQPKKIHIKVTEK